MARLYQIENNGNIMHISEKDFTAIMLCEMDFNTQEDRLFHLAIICWNLQSNSAQEDNKATKL